MTERMTVKITIIAVDPWLDRLHGSSILRLFSKIATLGYKVSILIPSSNFSLIKRNNNFLIKSLKIGNYIPIFTLLLFYKFALKELLREKPQLLIFDYPMLPIFLLCKLLWKCKGIMLILSRPVEEFKRRIRLFHFKLSLIMGRAFIDLFTAISPFEAFEFSKIGRIPINRMIIIPSPLGDEFVKSALSNNINELRVKLGLSSLLGKKILLYYGFLAKQRGILEILNLFYKSFKDDPQMVLLLVGDGPARNLIKEFIGQYKSNNIVFLGPVPYSKMPKLISACDIGIVLLPDNSLWRYQCPTKLVELLAMGKPCIVSDLPGIRWIAGETSLVTYLNRWEEKEFKRAVRLLMNQPLHDLDIWKTRQSMINRFSTFHIALKFKQLIDQLLS